MTHPSRVKGNAFERLIRDYLVEGGVPAERIPAGASDDRGDIWVPGHTIQAKNHARLNLAGWWDDTREQQANNRHAYGWIVHKRHGVTEPGAQWVTCNLAQLREVLSS